MIAEMCEKTVLEGFLGFLIVTTKLSSQVSYHFAFPLARIENRLEAAKGEGRGS